MDLDLDACYRAFRTRDPRFDGRLFSGCRTTGVYCRPVCPVRTPRRANMQFFATAAAAQEAGFRPCLRCRPETAPGLPAWRGSSATVGRALALIEAGALDEAGVDCLAERLGIGERQLRRLFHQHLGASPITVAQTRRVLLALQLLHETRLPMADVALGAGFASIRRFNEVFRRLYRRPPGALRRATGAGATAEDGGGVRVLLRYRPPYDWGAMLASLRASAIPGVEAVSSRRYARTFAIDGTHGTVCVEPAEGQALAVTIHARRLSILPTVLARVRRVFDLAADPHAIGAHLAEDPLLAPLVRSRPGLRVAGAWDGFELAVRAVLGRGASARSAAASVHRLVAACGERLTPGLGAKGGLTYVFPTAAKLGAIDSDASAIVPARAQRVLALAAAFGSSPAPLDGDPREAAARLRAIPGIDARTAEYIATRELREPDAFRPDDPRLLRGLAESRGDRVSPDEALARAERWRPWRAYAAEHLRARAG